MGEPPDPEWVAWCKAHSERMRGTKRPDLEGVLHPQSKLSEDDVLKVHAFVRLWGWTHQAAAEHFGVGAAQIGRIVRGEKWRHIWEQVNERIEDK